jgi:hypothetical protein
VTLPLRGTPVGIELEKLVDETLKSHGEDGPPFPFSPRARGADDDSPRRFVQSVTQSQTLAERVRGDDEISKCELLPKSESEKCRHGRVDSFNPVGECVGCREQSDLDLLPAEGFFAGRSLRPYSNQTRPVLSSPARRQRSRRARSRASSVARSIDATMGASAISAASISGPL